MKRTAFATAAALLLFAAPARAQDSATTPAPPPPEWVAYLQAQINATGEALPGYALLPEVRTGRMASGGTTDVQLDLEPGTYYIVGMCDIQCTDLDMKLMNAGGDLLDSDNAPDALPVLGVAVDRALSFRVTVEMPTCNTQECRYAVALYRQAPQ